MSVRWSSHARRNRWLGALFALVVAVGALAFTSAAGASTKAATTKCPDPSGTVKVGLSYFGNLAQQLEGIDSNTAALTPGAQSIINGYKAGIKALNDAGGLAGCQVSPVIYSFPAQSPDFNQATSTECASFTQDNKVVAVFTAGYETRVALKCYADAKTPLFQFGGSYTPTCADYKKYAGYVYSPIGVASCRFSSFVPIWNKAGLFPKNAKVGILEFDDGSGQSQYIADKVYTPALKKLGIPAPITFSYPAVLNTVSPSNDSQTAVSNAVLKFKSEGVNVVLFTPSGAQGVSGFLPPADTQGYYPAYGLASSDNLAIAAASGKNTLKKATAISWLVGDLPLTDQQALPTNPAVTKCAPWSQPGTTTLTGASAYCDFLNILQAGFANATKLDAKSLQKGIDALGTTFKSSMTYGGDTKFAKGHYDGITTANVLKWDPSTKAFVYNKAGQSSVTIP